VRGLFLENREEGIFGLFATHPPIEKRIAALMKYAGGRVSDPPPGPDGLQAPSPNPPPAGDLGPWGDHPKGPWD
jgi:heat shock protein HtpX